MYRKILLLSAFGFLAGFKAMPQVFAASSTASSTASATTTDQPASTFSFGVLDVMRLATEALVVRNIQEQLEKKSAEFQKEIATQNQKFQAENEKLVAGQSTLSPQEFQKKQMDLQKRFETFQADIDKKRGLLEEAYRRAMETVQKETDKIVALIASSKTLKYVFREPALAWYDTKEGLDITPDVLLILNKEFPKLVVKIPTPKELSAQRQQKPLPVLGK